MTLVHNDIRTHEQFLHVSVALGFGLVFVHLFTFSAVRSPRPSAIAVENRAG